MLVPSRFSLDTFHCINLLGPIKVQFRHVSLYQLTGVSVTGNLNLRPSTTDDGKSFQIRRYYLLNHRTTKSMAQVHDMYCGSVLPRMCSSVSVIQLALVTFVIDD